MTGSAGPSRARSTRSRECRSRGSRYESHVSLLSRANDSRERADQALGDLVHSLVRRRAPPAAAARGSAARRARPPAGGWAAGRRRRGRATRSTSSWTAPRRCRGSRPTSRRARSRVWLAGWFFSPALPAARRTARRLRDLLARDRAARRRARARLGRRAAAALPPRPRATCARRARRSRAARSIASRSTPASGRCTATTRSSSIVDGEVAFVGGIDLTSLGGDRLDTQRPPRSRLARLARRGGADPRPGRRGRRRALPRSAGARSPGEQLPAVAPPAPPGDVELQLVRTVPRRSTRACRAASSRSSSATCARSARPSGSSTSRASSSGRPSSSRCSRDKLRDPPDDGFRLLVVLPAKPNNGARRHARPARRARGGRRTAPGASSPARSTSAATDVAARLRPREDRHRRRPLAHDRLGQPERALALQRHRGEPRLGRELAREARLRLWSEHLECDPSELEGDPDQIVDERWRPQAGVDNGKLRLLPHVSRHAKGLLGPLNGFLVDG